MKRNLYFYVLGKKGVKFVHLYIYTCISITTLYVDICNLRDHNLVEKMFRISRSFYTTDTCMFQVGKHVHKTDGATGHRAIAAGV